MRGTLLSAVAATMVILLAPTATAGACISEIDLIVGLGTARFDMEQVFDGEDAAELRTLVDANAGNGDGEVAETEVAAWETAMSEPSGTLVRFCLAAWSGFMGGFVRMADEEPDRLEGFRATMDLEGNRSATAEDPLVLRFSATLGYETNGPEVTVNIFSDAFEGISEMIECFSPDSIESNYAQHSCGGGSDDPMEAMRRLEIQPTQGASIDPDSIQPAAARSAFDGRAVVLRDFVADEDTFPTIRFRLVDADGGSHWPWIAFGAAGLAGLGALIKTAGQRARFRLWWLLSVFGFTRIRRETALEHRRREGILAAIESEPGVHLGALQRGLDMATGTLVHHLRVLEGAGLVQTHRQSNRVHFVPAGYLGPIETTRSALQARLLDAIRSHPGLLQSELAEQLGEPRTTIAYNVRRLIEAGQIEVQREGRVVRHFVVG